MKNDEYMKIVEWSEEDKCYIGRCPELAIGGVHGKDRIKVYAELCEVADEWIAIHKQDNIPLPKASKQKDYSGKFNLRVGEELHEKLSIKALIAGQSLNNYCKNTLNEAISY